MHNRQPKSLSHEPDTMAGHASLTFNRMHIIGSSPLDFIDHLTEAIRGVAEFSRSRINHHTRELGVHVHVRMMQSRSRYIPSSTCVKYTQQNSSFAEGSMTPRSSNPATRP